MTISARSPLRSAISICRWNRLKGLQLKGLGVYTYASGNESLFGPANAAQPSHQHGTPDPALARHFSLSVTKQNHVGKFANFHTKGRRKVFGWFYGGGFKETWSTADGLTMTGKLAVKIDDFLKREMTRFRWYVHTICSSFFQFPLQPARRISWQLSDDWPTTVNRADWISLPPPSYCWSGGEV